MARENGCSHKHQLKTSRLGKTLENIFHQFYSPLCNYASKIVNDDFVAEDIVQSLFIQLHEKNKWNKIANIEGYLLRSVRFKCIDYLRKVTRAKFVAIDELSDLTVGSPYEITEEDIEPLFHYYAAKLPPKTREVFLLSRVSRLTYKEIADELNISVKTVENQMGRALKKMKELLKNNSVLLLYL